MTTTNKPWHDKAHAIIFAECQREFLRENRLPNGRMRQRHKPYCVPELAMELRECLNTENENDAKVIFLRLNLPPLSQ